MHTLLSCPTAMRLSCDHATAPGYGEGFWRSGRSIARRRGVSLPSRDARARFDTAFWTFYRTLSKSRLAIENRASLRKLRASALDSCAVSRGHPPVVAAAVLAARSRPTPAPPPRCRPRS